MTVTARPTAEARSAITSGQRKPSATRTIAKASVGVSRLASNAFLTALTVSRSTLRNANRRCGVIARLNGVAGGPLREYYLRGAADTPDEADWRTEIGWPIFPADASHAYG
jgi:hypothetical protein